ncbi:MAG: G5 domain-containing protein [Eubacteriaceae bacterium]|jgi:uncharacterized protein YabE (DUF348 family)
MFKGTQTGERTALSVQQKALLFLAAVLLLTVGGMICYQLLRRDPVTVTVKNAQGTYAAETVQSRPNETVRQVIDKTSFKIDSNYVCDHNENDRISDSDSVNLAEKVDGTISVDGQVINFSSGAHTIQDVLDENNITVAPVDQVSPSPDTILSVDTANITVYRITSGTQDMTETIPYTTEQRDNDQLAIGTQNVVQQGQDGVRNWTDQVTYSNGVETGRTTISSQQTDPVPEIIENGTDVSQGTPQVAEGDIEGWRPYVIQALKANGLEANESQITKVLAQIKTESNGNQEAHQGIIDINSLTGNAAEGLMQTIPSTFNSYKFDGHDDILNGYDNLLAAINYAKTVYGSDLNGLGEGHGY